MRRSLKIGRLLHLDMHIIWTANTHYLKLFCKIFFQNNNSTQDLYDKVTPLNPLKTKTALSNEDIMRYSRQLLLPQLAVQGELDSHMMHYFIKCTGLYCWSWLNVDWPKVSWTYPKRPCWLWVVEDWAAHWHSTWQQQALVGSFIHSKKVYTLCHHCLIFKFDWEEELETALIKTEITLSVLYCLGIMVWCLLTELISNFTGRLGLLDYDEVELNNLHRQVLHGEENQGQSKALSAAHAVRRYQLVLFEFIHIHKCMYCVNMCLNKCMYSVCVSLVMDSINLSLAR